MDSKSLFYEVAKLAEFDACDAIFWRWNEEHEELNVFATCSDVFDWGTADVELITEENLPVLKQAVADVREITGSDYSNQSDAFLLFCARVRGCRPQGAFYRYLDVTHMVPSGENRWGNPKTKRATTSTRRTTSVESWGHQD